jgi:uncharacterized protein YhfF
MTDDAAIQDLWESYLETLPQKNESSAELPQCWSFGDGPAMADELGGLVLAGIKTATCSLFWEYQLDGEEIPRVGEMSIILDGSGNPLCVIETTEVTVKPFRGVDAQFAYDEGEGDRSYGYWRESHTRFFTRACRAMSCEFSDEMQVVCERFRRIFP